MAVYIGFSLKKKKKNNSYVKLPGGTVPSPILFQLGIQIIQTKPMSVLLAQSGDVLGRSCGSVKLKRHFGPDLVNCEHFPEAAWYPVKTNLFQGFLILLFELESQLTGQRKIRSNIQEQTYAVAHYIWIPWINPFTMSSSTWSPLCTTNHLRNPPMFSTFPRSWWNRKTLHSIHRDSYTIDVLYTENPWFQYF